MEKCVDEKLIDECAEEYHQSIDRMAKLVRTVVEKLENELRNEGILASVSGRVKNRKSLHEKLTKWAERPEKVEKLKSKRGVFEVVGDLAAVRVMTYIEDDRGKVTEIAKRIFSHRTDKQNYECEEKELDPRIKDDSSNFYRATHMQITLKKQDLEGGNSNLAADHCELQITSMLAHVWNEIEHDIAYKVDKTELSTEERSALESLGLLTKSGDNIISTLISANNERKAKNQWKACTISTSDDLLTFLKDHFGDIKPGESSIKFEYNIEMLLETLAYLDLCHPEQLIREITPRLLQEAYQSSQELLSFMEKEHLQRNKIEPTTCDVVFMVLAKKYLNRLQERNRHGGTRDMTLVQNYNRMNDAKKR